MLSSGANVPTSRFRMLPYVPRLRAAGHVCRVASSFPPKYEYIPWLGFRPSQKLKRAVRYGQWLVSRLRQDDLVVIDREIFDAPTTRAEERFRRTVPCLVLDLDDAVFLRYPDKFERLSRLVDLIICGNSRIQAWAAERNPNTVVIPSCVDMTDYPLAEPFQTSRVPRIGWMGTASNLECLDVVAPALRRLARSERFEVLIVTEDPARLAGINLSGVEVKVEHWRACREYELLRSMDVGMMPLNSDSQWNWFKCGMKLIQYMAAGRAAVASPVGVNAEIVVSGDNGFLAESEAEWEGCLRRLLADAVLRQRVGEAARRTVAENYSIQSWFPRYEAALRGAAQNRFRKSRPNP